jgi:hypothetical protein
MYEKEMLEFLFDAYKKKRLNLWKLPNENFIRLNGGLDLDVIVKSDSVQELTKGNVYLAAPVNHNNGPIESVLSRLFVKYLDFIVAMYTFGVNDRIIATKEDGSITDFSYFEFINAVGKLPSLIDARI